MGQQALHSLAVGSIYALLAMGLTFMYGAHRSLYLAYGGLYALGGYVAWWAIRSSHTVWVALSLAVLLCPVVGFLLSWGVWTHGTRASERSHLLFGLGGLICLEELLRLLAGPHRRKVMALDSHQFQHLGPLMVSDRHWVVFGVTFVVLMALHGFLSTSRLGRAVQTFVQQDAGAAMRRERRAWLGGVACGVGSALAGVGGVLGGLYLNDVHPAMGTVITHKLLALVLIGTLGRWQEAVLMAFAYAVFEEVFVPAWQLPIPADVGLLVVLAVVGMRSSHRVHGPR